MLTTRGLTLPLGLGVTPILAKVNTGFCYGVHHGIPAQKSHPYFLPFGLGITLPEPGLLLMRERFHAHQFVV